VHLLATALRLLLGDILPLFLACKTHTQHRQIFSIHAKKWNPPLPERLVTEVADMCVGYCGADLKVMQHHPMQSHFACVRHVDPRRF
jgi:hypothetical protein